MSTLAAFARNDWRNLRRESLLLYLVVLPWLLVLASRAILPILADWLLARGVDPVPYYPLLLGFMFILQGPMMFGIVVGLLILDERDADTLTALRVTPLPLRAYALYRVGFAFALGTVFALLAPPLTGLLARAVWPALLPIGVLAGLLAAASALFLAAFAGNKVEGLALMKVAGVFMAGPFLAAFLPPNWQLVVGALPSTWPAKAFWLAAAGESWGLSWLVGAVYLPAVLAWLLKRFERQVSR